MKVKKPRVLTRCVANNYAKGRERIIEFAGDYVTQGGLIAFRITDDGRMLVDIYRQGSDVEVRVGEPDQDGGGAGVGSRVPWKRSE